jgi:hypothetical protein
MKALITLLLACALCLRAENKLGKPLTLSQPESIDKILASPDQFTGKTVQVKGKVTEVCQMMGCWMNLVDATSGKSIRVKVNDGDIIFPKDSAGKTAIAEGKLEKLALTKEQAAARAKHEAEEQGRKFDPAKVKGSTVIYQIAGTGAVILE